jgi:hypothetical protein
VLKNSILSLFACFFTPLFFPFAGIKICKAQESTNQKKTDLSPIDTSYIKTFPDRIAIRFIREVQLVSIVYELEGLKDLQYNSNNPTNTGFGIDYKWLSLEYTRSLPWTKAHPLKGESRMQGIGVATSTRKIWFKAFYRENTGFYLENTDVLLPNFKTQNEQQFYQRPDIRANTFFSTLNYCFNHRRFSNSSNLYQLEQQRRSAGSFISGLSLVRNGYTADSALLPKATAANTEGIRQTVLLLVLSVGVNIGYIHNFSFGAKRQWFFNIGAIPGIAYQSGNRKLSNGVVNRFSTTGVNSELRLSAGYNHGRWFSCFGFRYFSVFNEADKTNSISIAYSSGHVCLGYRFNSPENRPSFLKTLGL